MLKTILPFEFVSECFNHTAPQNKSKAMQIAVGFHGVNSAGLQGEGKDELVVKGVFDPVELVALLRERADPSGYSSKFRVRTSRKISFISVELKGEILGGTLLTRVVMALYRVIWILDRPIFDMYYAQCEIDKSLVIGGFMPYSQYMSFLEYPNIKPMQPRLASMRQDLRLTIDKMAPFTLWNEVEKNITPDYIPQYP
nr:heavy metal-associated isoprenylated plant protein 46-like [Ipomoea batatas]